MLTWALTRVTEQTTNDRKKERTTLDMIQILRDVLTIPLGIALCSISGEAQTDKSLPKAPVTGRQVPCPATGPFLDIKASGDPAEQQMLWKPISLQLSQADGGPTNSWANHASNSVYL